MVRFILITFAFLGWAFYELSGGSDFDPELARLTNIKTNPLQMATVADDETVAVQEDSGINVTRVSLNLTSVDDVLVSNRRPRVNLPQQTVEQDTTAEPVRVILPSLVEGADQTAATVVQQPAVAAVAADIRTVSGNRVNVRGGPGTSFGVVNKLVRGDAVEVLDDDGSGWVRLRPVDGGPIGYMADFLLTDG